jgi:hypothetical protein
MRGDNIALSILFFQFGMAHGLVSIQRYNLDTIGFR